MSTISFGLENAKKQSKLCRIGRGIIRFIKINLIFIFIFNKSLTFFLINCK